MIINPTVAKVCNQWKINPNNIQAMIQAEGGNEAFIRAVRIGVSYVGTFEEAVDVACRTYSHKLNDFMELDSERFRKWINYLGSKWAPIGAMNDPHGLNKNWVPNVLKALGKE
jgi:hypothetical protein